MLVCQLGLVALISIELVLIFGFIAMSLGVLSRRDKLL